MPQSPIIQASIVVRCTITIIVVVIVRPSRCHQRCSPLPLSLLPSPVGRRHRHPRPIRCCHRRLWRRRPCHCHRRCLLSRHCPRRCHHRPLLRCCRRRCPSRRPGRHCRCCHCCPSCCRICHCHRRHVVIVVHCVSLSLSLSLLPLFRDAIWRTTKIVVAATAVNRIVFLLLLLVLQEELWDLR